jgi:hypothetical protein
MRLIENVSESLQTEMRVMKDSLHRIETRMDRIGGLVNGGSRALTRLAVWSESVDQMLADRDRRIDDLTRRVERLEKR